MKNSVTSKRKFLRVALKMLFTLFLILNLASCDEQNSEDERIPMNLKSNGISATEAIKIANVHFRTNILNTLYQFTTVNNLPEIDEDFVFVNPMNCYTSPIALT